MAGITDVLSTIQNGVTSFNNLTTQMRGSFNNISGQLTTLSSQITSISSQITNISSQIAALQAVQSSSSRLTNSLSSDVLLNNNALYFNGPSITQGSNGTWFASGSITLVSTAASANFFGRLWDGTTIINSAEVTNGAAGFFVTITLSGYISSPSSDLKISCRCGSTIGKILFNATGDSKDSTISAFRIA